MSLAPEVRREAAMPLADLLRRRTQALHRKAERSGIIADILNGRATQTGYALLLRNLHPVYQALERCLEAALLDPRLSFFAQPGVYRTAAIEADLENLFGERWSCGLPLLPAAGAYASRIETAAGSQVLSLLGHSYTRYLGDLNGGQVLRRLLGRRLDLGPESLSFYDFPAVADLEGFRTSYREAFNRVALSPAETDAVAREAALAFRHNIVLSREVCAAGGVSA